jgi:hypothetical protein
MVAYHPMALGTRRKVRGGSLGYDRTACRVEVQVLRQYIWYLARLHRGFDYHSPSQRAVIKHNFTLAFAQLGVLGHFLVCWTVSMKHTSNNGAYI